MIKRVVAYITLFAENPKKANSLIRALNPDNTSLPYGIEVQVFRFNNVVRFMIKVDGNSGRFLHTFNDIMLCLLAVDNSINTLIQK